MGWCHGTEIMDRVVPVIRKQVPDEAARRAIYVALVGAMREQDWDTEDEACGLDPVLDALLPVEELEPPANQS